MKYKLALLASDLYQPVWVRLVCLVVVAALFPISVFSQDRINNIDEFITKAHEYKLFNGVVLVGEKNKIVYSKAIGLANMEWDVPHKMDSRFKIASLSKQFTCMLILQLVAEGKIDLDSTINDYLPDYPAEQGSRVKIRHLMSHTSGIPNYSDFENWYSELWIREYSTEQFLELFKHLDLEFVPGSRFHYGNSGYHVLAAIIKQVCGRPFERVINERIFLPLDMTDSGCIDINTMVPRLASPYEYWHSRFTRSDYINPTTTEGAGSVYTTAPDFWKWHRALTSSKLIPQHLTNEMIKTQINISGSFGYGFGLEIGQVSIDGTKHDYIGHTGAIPGFNSLYAWFSQSDRFIMILNNTGRTRLNYMRDEIMKVLEGGDYFIQTPAEAEAPR